MRRTEVGFVVTPDEIAARIEGLDNAIVTLASQVGMSKAPRLDAAWRGEFHAFLRRWGPERDAYAAWGARLFNNRVEPRIEAFERSYRWWAKSFETRSGETARAAIAVPSTGLIPTWAWLAMMAGAFVLLRGSK